MEEIRYWQYKWKEEHQQSTLEKLKQLRERETEPYLKGRQHVNVDINALDTLPDEDTPNPAAA